MKSSNCLTRSLHHWDKYGGQIVYDGNHVKVLGGERDYYDSTYMFWSFDIKDYGIEYFLSSHSDFLNDQEIKILTKYFEGCSN